MSDLKYTMDIVFGILKYDQSQDVHMDNAYLTALAKRSGWAKSSLELILEMELIDEGFEEPISEEDNVSQYYARRELETRDESRSASGYNSDGEIVELDFN